MKRLDIYFEDWYYVLEHFYQKSEWVTNMTIAYKNAELKKYNVKAGD